MLRASAGLHPEIDARIDEAARLPSEDEAGAPAHETLAALAGRLGLPTRLSDVDVGTEELPRLERLLRERYPQSVAELGPDAGDRLTALLRSIA